MKYAVFVALLACASAMPNEKPPTISQVVSDFKTRINTLYETVNFARENLNENLAMSVLTQRRQMFIEIVKNYIVSIPEHESGILLNFSVEVNNRIPQAMLERYLRTPNAENVSKALQQQLYHAVYFFVNECYRITTAIKRNNGDPGKRLDSLVQRAVNIAIDETENLIEALANPASGASTSRS